MSLTLESIFSPGALVGHFGYGLLILSMLMTHMLWLRMFAIASSLVGLSYSIFWLHDPVGSFWESSLILTNVGQLSLLAYRNRITRFTPEERTFYEMAVPNLEPVDVRRLLQLGRWVDALPEVVVTRQGEPVTDLIFIVSGMVHVAVDGHRVASCGPGHFIGEISVATGGPATATSTISTPTRYLAFDAVTLRRLLDGGSEAGRAMEHAFRHGLREKLLQSNAAMVAIRRAEAI
jgi:CRP-like cAMP-binding protein